MGLVENEDETKYLLSSNEHKLEVADNFVFLGTSINTNNNKSPLKKNQN